MNIAVLGAGISGLSAAYRLRQLMPNATIRVFDRRNRYGGVLETLNRNGFQIEQSADNFITTIPWGVKLCKELGLGEQLVQTNPLVRRTYVVRSGRLYLLPDGFLMMAPTKLLPMAVTPILSPFGKLRAGLELFIPARKDNLDESMAHFVRRRLGREVFERLVEPLVSGVYAADMEKLSVLATLPRFREMERDHGSLIRAMQKQLAANRAAHLAEQSGARYSMFVTLRNGLSSLCDALAKTLQPETLQIGREVTKIQKTAEGQWLLETKISDSRTATSQTAVSQKTSIISNVASPPVKSTFVETENFDAIIFATPIHESSRLLRDSMPELAGKLAKIEHEGTAVATFAFNLDQIKQTFRGMGFVVPKAEQSPILAGSFSSLKYEHRAPDGKFLIRIFAGGSRSPELAELPADRLIPLLWAEMRKILKINGEPLFTVIAHWSRTMPQYHVGHRELVQDIETLANSEPTLALAGNAFHGVGIPNCIQSGFLAAEKLSASLVK
ncbi:MAG: protoporphyrinogen oxidase [Planctomycetaceae bacterium]|jgi:oxygen-dependent protoporphyrinogen oxidase|nr:protoporphyrinogen oxidase [Planctomycetaceae bacterium]